MPFTAGPGTRASPLDTIMAGGSFVSLSCINAAFNRGTIVNVTTSGTGPAAGSSQVPPNFSFFQDGNNYTITCSANNEVSNPITVTFSGGKFKNSECVSS